MLYTTDDASGGSPRSNHRVRSRRGFGRPGLCTLLLAAALTLTCGAADLADVNEGLVDFSAGRFGEAFAAWQAAAKAGNPDGDLYMGVLYDTGEGVVQDYAKALAFYKRAADAGSAAGAFNVGVFYDSGIGVAANPREAAVWYRKAAAKDFARAEYNLALLEEGGAGVPRNRTGAIALFRQAAAQGLGASRSHLAALGQHVTQASVKPKEDALTDFQRAQDTLLNRGAADAARLATLFRRAADRHNAVAEYDLGYCYEHGVGIAADPAQARTWYKRALADTQDSHLHEIAQESASKLDRQAAATGRAD